MGCTWQVNYFDHKKVMMMLGTIIFSGLRCEINDCGEKCRAKLLLYSYRDDFAQQGVFFAAPGSVLNHIGLTLCDGYYVILQ